MGFEVFTPTRASGIEVGQCSISAGGAITLTVADLRRAGIKDRVVILVDVGMRRMALRQARDDGGLAEPSVRLKVGKANRTGTMQCAGALKAIGCPPPKSKGRYDAMVKDDLLIVQVGDPSRRAKA